MKMEKARLSETHTADQQRASLIATTCALRWKIPRSSASIKKTNTKNSTHAQTIRPRRGGGTPLHLHGWAAPGPHFPVDLLGREAQGTPEDLHFPRPRDNFLTSSLRRRRYSHGHPGSRPGRGGLHAR